MFDWRNRPNPRSGMKALADDPQQLRCQAPAPLVIVATVLLFGPQLALMGVLLAQNSRLQLTSVLIEWAPLIMVKLGFLSLGLVKIPVVVDAEGIRFAWFYRMAWSDIVNAKIRTRFGLRLLEISQREGYTWRIWLYWFGELPMFLTTHAPLDSAVHGM